MASIDRLTYLLLLPPNASRDSRLLLFTVSFLKGVDCSDNFTGPLPTFLRAFPVNANTLKACVP